MTLSLSTIVMVVIAAIAAIWIVVVVVIITIVVAVAHHGHHHVLHLIHHGRLTRVEICLVLLKAVSNIGGSVGRMWRCRSWRWVLVVIVKKALGN